MVFVIFGRETVCIMKITIVDIAKLAGVSQATVSRVINNPEKVKEPTRRKIQRIMEENSYVYNALAGGLGKKTTRTIGLIIPTITNPIFAVSTQGVQTAAAQRGYSILLGSTEYSGKMEFDLVRLFLQKRVDGIILTGTPLHERSIEYVSQRNIPFAITYERIKDDTTSFVAFDNVKASDHTVDYLYSMGHRRIGMITGHFSDSNRSKNRWEGYRAGLQKRGIPYDGQLVMQKDFTAIFGREAATRMLQHPNPPTAIFCGNDIIAYGAMAAAKDKGLKVGVDIGIVGFDDIEMSAVMNPPLTTTRIPGDEMGAMSAKILIDRIEKINEGPMQYTLETDFIVRSSVSNLNKRGI